MNSFMFRCAGGALVERLVHRSTPVFRLLDQKGHRWVLGLLRFWEDDLTR